MPFSKSVSGFAWEIRNPNLVPLLWRARNYLEDQLLGFALVPMSLVAGEGKGIRVKFQFFHQFEVVLLNREMSEVGLDPVEYERIEFPDINVVRENQQMVSTSDDRSSIDSMEKKSPVANESSDSPVQSISVDAHPSSEASPERQLQKRVFKAPIGNINIEAEQNSMQQQIVDMYMRSMQQFTESLAKMKLPMDLDKPEQHDNGGVIQQHNKKTDLEKRRMGQGCSMVAAFSDRSG
ncbi:hypothetical protein IFM89_026556 [Coptis chinensis]|uniref:Uncharacterized protein n=1 Tax=Coptis chinensis TaxID=261450 RepID=A0A835HF97_9MAGN|nr:hypothetical protein IFM89_026556 [Coptis chinensis]